MIYAEFVLSYISSCHKPNTHFLIFFKVFFSLGGQNANVIDYIVEKNKQIITGNADAGSIVITDEVKEELGHIAETLQTVLAVAGIMAPISDIGGVHEMESINQARRNFAASMR